ncbi:MAG: hypothetical protein CUN53_15965 [Phototrophicales bacterium]|nr:MAG: hypothetical protein CUN53_15965 [Phototrophicales bacterium]
MSRAEDALMALYEDASLRDELVDDDAETLYHWAEAKIVRIDAEYRDDEAFEEAVSALRRVLEGINHFIGERAFKSDEENEEALAQIVDWAEKMGCLVRLEDAPDLTPHPPAEEAAFGDDVLRSFSVSESAVPPDDSAALAALLAWLDGGTDMPTDDPPFNY